MILYALLCGSLPFDDEHVPNLFKKIKHGSFTVPGHLSENARRLIVRMLTVDPSQRISFKEIRRHPWTREQTPLSSCLWQPPEPTTVDLEVLKKLCELGYEVSASDIIRHQKGTTVFLPKEVVAYNLLSDCKRARVATNAEPTSEKDDSAYAFSREIRTRHWTASMFHADYSPFGVMSTINDTDKLQTRPLSFIGAGVGTEPSLSRQLSKSSVGSVSNYSHWSGADTPRWRIGVESSMRASTIMTAVGNQTSLPVHITVHLRFFTLCGTPS